jgi:hypothetical protein
VLAILVARHPDLNERAFRLVPLPLSSGWGSPGRHGAGLPSVHTDEDVGDPPDAFFEFVGRTADYSGRPMIAPTTQVFIGDDEPLPHTGERLLYGTLVATGSQPDGNGQAVPSMPPSGEWLLLMPGLGHAVVLGVPHAYGAAHDRPSSGKPSDRHSYPAKPGSGEPADRKRPQEEQPLAPSALPDARLDSDPGQPSSSSVQTRESLQEQTLSSYRGGRPAPVQ